MTTFAELQNRVARLVSDPDGTTYGDEIYLDAIQAAHDAVLPWIPNYCSVLIPASSGSGGAYPLPDNVYDIQAVRIGTGKYISKATLASGTNRPTSLTACDWIETPKGYLNISANGENVTEDILVNYLGHWAKPTKAADIIQVPQYGHMGLVYYSASIVVTPVVVDISTLGPFKIRVESGTPEDNPMMRTSEWFRNLFLQEMKMMPPYQKARS